MKRIFDVDVECEEVFMGCITLEVDQRVIEQVTDGWRRDFYDLRTPEDIVEHIAYNMVVNDLNISQLDGFADLDDSMVQITFWNVDRPEYGIHAKEVNTTDEDISSTPDQR